MAFDVAEFASWASLACALYAKVLLNVRLSHTKRSTNSVAHVSVDSPLHLEHSNADVENFCLSKTIEIRTVAEQNRCLTCRRSFLATSLLSSVIIAIFKVSIA